MANNATITIVGNLTSDPQVNTTQNNQSKMSFTVAVNTSLKKEGGDYEANFYYVSVFGRPIEWLTPVLQKGTMVEVSGDFNVSHYASKKTGETVTSLNVTAFKVLPLARTKDRAKRQSMDPTMPGETSFPF